MLIELPSLQTGNVNANRDIQLTQPTKTLETGQVTKAVVVAARQDGHVTLSIDGGHVNAKSQHRLQVGEELQVKVVKEDGADVLQIQNKQLSSEVLNAALRQILPNQNIAAKLVTQITQLLNSVDNLENLDLPDDVQQQLRQLINRLPTSQQIQNPSGLKSALENGGTFLEAKMANSVVGYNPTIDQDLKAGLLKVLKAIDTGNQQTKTIPQSNHSNATPQPMTDASTRQTKQNSAALSTQQTKVLEQASRVKQVSQSDTPNTSPEIMTKRLPGAIAQTSLATTSAVTNTAMLATNNTLAHASIPLRGAVPQPLSATTTSTTPEPNSVPTNTPSIPNSIPTPAPGSTPIATPVDNQETKTAETQIPIDSLDDLREEVTKTLARVQANQLSALPREGHQQPFFLVDLPVKIGQDKTEVIPFLIEEEPSETTEQEQGKQWSIMLALELENLGPLQLKATMSGEHVAINIWADHPATKVLFEQRNQQLEEALEEEGVSVSRLSYHEGLKPNNIDRTTIKLLDLKA